MAGVRAGLLSEIFVMSWDTLRGNKMRSALTVLGVVIGITSIVGMTSLIRGFDQSLRDLIAQSGRTSSTCSASASPASGPTSSSSSSGPT